MGKTKLLHKLPLILIYSRLFLGALVLLLSGMPTAHFPTISISLLSLGLLTDIFDGIIARHLQISTERLRRLDSSVDQIFYLSFVAACFIRCPEFFLQHQNQILLLFAAEALSYVWCFIKFKKIVATHSWGSKLWSFSLFACLIQFCIQCTADQIFIVCFWLGLVTRLENTLIIMLLKSWTNDVPSFYHAMQLRRGRPIKRHKLLNG